jgi:hypothetical protein
MADERCVLQIRIGQGTQRIGSADNGGGDLGREREAPHDRGKISARIQPDAAHTGSRSVDGAKENGVGIIGRVVQNGLELGKEASAARNGKGHASKFAN